MYQESRILHRVSLWEACVKTPALHSATDASDALHTQKPPGSRLKDQALFRGLRRSRYARLTDRLCFSERDHPVVPSFTPVDDARPAGVGLNE